MATKTICPYCLPDQDRGTYNDDHVIPAKLGGTIVVRTHERCNTGAADNVDNPLLNDPDVEMLRGLSGARNVRTGRFRGAQFRGDLADDAPALLRANPEGVVVEQVGAGEPQLREDGTFVFSLPPCEDLAARADKVLEGLRDKFPHKTVELVDQEARSSEITIERSWGLVPWVWPRFAAKVALGVLSLTMPPDWRGSDGELFLLALFRAGRVIGSQGGLSAVPTHLDETDAQFRHLYPWEHVVIVQTHEGAVVVSLVLFGSLRYDLGVATELEPVGPRVWLCDFREREPLTFDSVRDFAAASTERFALFGDLTPLRHDRPRSNLVGPVGRARLRETPVEVST